MKVKHEYNDLSPDQVKALFKNNGEHLLGQYGSHVGKHRWVSDSRIEASGRGVKASAYVEGNAIIVEGKLPFALKIFASKIESVVKEKLAKMASQKV